MVALDAELPEYRFAEHKGYCTPVHDAALIEHGPSPVHRYSFVNVRGAWASRFGLPSALVHNELLPVGSSEPGEGGLELMSAEDLEKYETEMELQLYREYRDIVGLFSYVVETERRFYLANAGRPAGPRNADGEVYFEVTMPDAWVWDMYRPARFVKNVRVLTFKDVNIEELDKPDLRAAREVTSPAS